MSFDVFVQGFKGGDAANGDGIAAMKVLQPLISEQSTGWARLTTDDGEADVYGLDDPASGLMFNHVGGRFAWDVIFDAARAAGFVIMPAGCGTLLPDPALRPELPEGVPEPVKVVHSGAELLAAVKSAS